MVAAVGAPDGLVRVVLRRLASQSPDKEDVNETIIEGNHYSSYIQSDLLCLLFEPILTKRGHSSIDLKYIAHILD